MKVDGQESDIFMVEKYMGSSKTGSEIYVRQFNTQLYFDQAGDKCYVSDPEFPASY